MPRKNGMPEDVRGMTFGRDDQRHNVLFGEFLNPTKDNKFLSGMGPLHLTESDIKGNQALSGLHEGWYDTHQITRPQYEGRNGMVYMPGLAVKGPQQTFKEGDGIGFGTANELGWTKPNEWIADSREKPFTNQNTIGEPISKPRFPGPTMAAKGGDAPGESGASKVPPEPKYGLRPDGTPKGSGWLGELKLPGGGVATEYSVGVNIGGKEMDIPSLVPTLTKDEVADMVTNVIPRGASVPEPVLLKAVAHAKERLAKGESVWAPEGTNSISSVRQASKAGDAGAAPSKGVPSGHNPVLDGYSGPRIVINPSTFHNEKDGLCVAFDEAFRIIMEVNGFDPVAEPTGRQRKFFSDTAYSDDERMMRRTILARICTFDTSVADPTDEQLEEAVEFLDTVMEIGAPQNQWEQRAVQRIRDAVAASVGQPRSGAAPEPPHDAGTVEAGIGAGTGASEEDGQHVGTGEDEQRIADQQTGGQAQQPDQSTFANGKDHTDAAGRRLGDHGRVAEGQRPQGRTLTAGEQAWQDRKNASTEAWRERNGLAAGERAFGRQEAFAQMFGQGGNPFAQMFGRGGGGEESPEKKSALSVSGSRDNIFTIGGRRVSSREAEAYKRKNGLV